MNISTLWKGLVTGKISASALPVPRCKTIPECSRSSGTLFQARRFLQKKAGVKIYEYTPGFVHAKGCVIDDEVGTIGTVNLDYRSLFLHFENNSLFYQVPALKDLKEDFAATQEQCRERTLDDIGVSFWKWILDGVLRIFAPLC